jgi:hypothetical protein
MTYYVVYSLFLLLMLVNVVFSLKILPWAYLHVGGRVFVSRWQKNIPKSWQQWRAFFFLTVMAARNMEEEQSLRECEAYVQMHDIQKILKAAFESLKTLSWFFFVI